MNASAGIQVINRAAQVLRQLKHDNSGQSLGGIAAQTGLPRSTVQRIVNALIAEGFIATTGKNGDLRLGPEIHSLAAAGHVDVAAMLRPDLKTLSDRTGETVDLAIFNTTSLTFVDQIAGRQRLRAVSVPGEDFPLTTTANGKAVLSMLEDDDIAEFRRLESAKVTLKSLLAEIAQIRKDGVAFDLDEHTQGISAAGIAFQTLGKEIYAVSIPAPSERFLKNRQTIEKALTGFAKTTIGGNPYFLTPAQRQVS